MGDAVTVGVPDGSVPTIPGYTVLEELGRGGMGVVFKATAEQLNRFVALKMILSGDLASPEAGARFLKEAEAVARLQHPQVVQIFRIGDYNGRPYLEMEYVDGGSLADRLDGRPWNPTEAARLVESLALAVHHAHIREIVHRDLKPANILLTADGIPKVTDFGLAKSLGADIGLTRTDSIIGSPSYMAPEQAGGTASRIGPATDVYSLGAILYELLTGRPPFRAATVLDTLEQVRSAEPAPPSRIQPGLPIDLETIVLKCLEKEPTRRYPSAEALAAEIRRFCAGEPIRARPVGFVGRGVKLGAAAAADRGTDDLECGIDRSLDHCAREEQRRHQPPAARRRSKPSHASGGSGRSSARANDRLAEQQRQTQAALENKTVALEATSEDLQRERQASYFQRIALADSERLAGRYDRVDQVLAGCPADLRGWEWRYLKQSSRREPLAFIGHTGEVWDAAISPDGLRLASASFDHTIKLWDVATGKLERTLRGHKERAYSVGFDKDGTHLVSASADKTAIIWDVASGKRASCLARATRITSAARRSASTGTPSSPGVGTGIFRVWNADTGEYVSDVRNRRGMDYSRRVQPRLPLRRRRRFVGAGRGPRSLFRPRCSGVRE